MPHPVTFVCHRKYVCSLEASPNTIISFCLFSRDDASTISLANGITKTCDTGSGRQRDCTEQPRFISDSERTYCNQWWLNDTSIEECYIPLVRM